MGTGPRSFPSGWPTSALCAVAPATSSALEAVPARDTPQRIADDGEGAVELARQDAGQIVRAWMRR